MSKVSKEVAVEDLNRFMESFRLDPIKKGKLDDCIEECIELIQYGMLCVTEENQLKFELIEPIVDSKGEAVQSSVVFGNKRVSVKDIQDQDDCKTQREQMSFMVGKLTGLNKGLIEKLSADDITYITSIARFFMPVR